MFVHPPPSPIRLALPQELWKREFPSRPLVEPGPGLFLGYPPQPTAFSAAEGESSPVGG